MSQTERILKIQQMLQDRRVISKAGFLDELEISPAQLKEILLSFATGSRSRLIMIRKSAAI